MPFRQLPNSDLRRAVALDAIHHASVLVPNPEWPLSAANIALAADHRKKLLVESTEAADALQTQLREVSEKDAAAAVLGLHISHFCQVLDFAIDRGTFRAATRIFYQRETANALVPLTNTDASVLAWGHRLVDGEAARAQAEGAAYVPMTMPDAGEVAAALAIFIKELGDANAAQASAQDEAEDVADLRKPLDFFIRDAWDSIEFFHRHDPPTARRRKSRVWGVHYFLRPGETPDPEEFLRSPA